MNNNIQYNNLVVDYIPLAFKAAFRYKDKGISSDELRGLAMEGLLKARDYYDPEKGSFSNVVNLQVSSMVTGEFIKRSAVSRMDLKYGEEIDNVGAEDSFSKKAMEGRVYNKQLGLVIKKSLSILPDRHRDIIESRYLEDEPVPLVKLATKYGVSHQRIQEIEGRSLEILRKELGAYDKY